jgi:hypothetical protein
VTNPKSAVLFQIARETAGGDCPRTIPHCESTEKQ